MSNIEKWNYIYETYNECSREAILRSKSSLKDIKKNKKYWSFIVAYFIVSLIPLYYSQTYFLTSVFLIVTTTLFLNFLIELELSKDLKKYYPKSELRGLSLVSKTKYLSYTLFRKRLKKDKVVIVSDIDSMIQWDKVKNKKIDTSIFFKSKWLIALVTGTIAILVSHATEPSLNAKEVVVIAYVAIIVIWFSWIIFIFLKTKDKKRLDIHKFIKWFKLDSEKTKPTTIYKRIRKRNML